MTPETEASSSRDPLDALAEQFAERYRRGEQPSVEEYAGRYPEMAEELRRLLPTVAFLEAGRRKAAGPGSGSGEIAEAAALPFERLGENRLVREIGRGGMGVVYEAIQEPLGRRVAVKVLPGRASADGRGRERFLREAKAIARLRHPHIVPIHALGEQDGTPYYVMPLVDGAGLDRVLADRDANVPADPAGRARWVAELGVQAAGALAHAHDEGILHRDIKPANLLLDSDGTLWLADFGLAKLADDLALTATGELPGTLRYLAPECLTAEPDARSDVYSLGLTLYELLVGRPAFGETDRIRLLHQIQWQPVEPLRDSSLDVPRDLETIILKASAQDPATRYPSAAALADDLARFLDGRPILARRASSWERLGRWRRRNPVVSGLAALSVVLGLFGGYFFILFLLAPRGPGAPPPPGPPLRGEPLPGFDGPPEPGAPPRPPPPPRGFDRPPRKEGRPRPASG
ncbi:MAG TPA: serine/threonine-protein kinase [Isosphaeraceae bacterium]